MTIKADIMKKILTDAEAVKPIEGLPNAYSPADYEKIRAKARMEGLMRDGMNADGRYRPSIPEGAVEFDMNGNLRKLGRTAPKMIDLNRYTVNRYMVEKVGVPEKGEKTKRKSGTYIIVVFGEAIVKAITAMNELPKTVKAFRYRKTDGGWEYVGAEFIEDKVAYTLKSFIKPTQALKLMQMIEKKNAISTKEEGDDLSDI